MIIYTLKTCDTCRKAVRELRENGHEPHIIDVRQDGIAASELARFHRAFGEKLANRRSTTWRGLSGAQRLIDPVKLLSEFPTLMKRPVIDIDGNLFLGWDNTTRKTVLGI